MTTRGISPPVLVAAVALVLVACILVVLVNANGNRPTTGGAPVPTAQAAGAGPSVSLNEAATYAAHVDATFDTLTAIFQDAEGSSLEQFAADSHYAAEEETWIAAQPRLPCLAAAATQYASSIALLKADMDASVEDFKSGNAVAIASSNAQIDPARPALLLAKEAVDEAAARC